MPYRRLFTASRLISLKKKPTGVRPIAIGESWLRIIGRLILRMDPILQNAYNNNTAPIEYVGKYQFGVLTRSGTETVIHAIRESLMTKHAMAHLSLDFKNAYNLLNRPHIANEIAKYAPSHLGYFRLLYQHTAALYCTDQSNDRIIRLSSATGLRQGDVLAPLWYCIGVRNILDTVAERHPLTEVRGFIDNMDIMILQPPVTQDAETNSVSSALPTTPAAIVVVGPDCSAIHPAVVAAVDAGGRVERGIAAADDLAGGQALCLLDADGRRYEVVHGDALRPADAPAPPDQPLRLAHAVLNCHAIAQAQAFLERALGFVLADRTRIMAFMNCDADHHSLALGDTDNDALNHIAFVMPTLDAVMRGGGRMKDAGHGIEWGPGRHGPGDNAFNYFIDPFGIVIEYTAEVEQIDDGYRPGAPTDWTWPPGRVDQWGIGTAPTEQLKQAQRRVFFAASL